MVDVQFKKQPFSISSLLLGIVFFNLLVRMVQPVNGQTPEPSDFCSMPFQPVAAPLTELGNTEYRRMDGRSTGFTGGLYPNGSNSRPARHEAAGLELSRQIQPLTKDGQVDKENGRILVISIGMSNTATEFGAFTRLAQQKVELNPRVVLLNGALPNQVAERWANPKGIAWQELDRRITGYGFSPQQVQVAWVKLTNTGGGDFPQKALALQADLQAIVQHLNDQFPNLKLVFLSSRTRSYTYWRGLSPEPLAYETGFAVKWLIEKQIEGDSELNFDPKQGKVRAAHLSWGPYLWADGENPREDGFLWTGSDLTNDCTHPSPAGAEKIAQQLWEFFSADTLTRDWFLLSAKAEVEIHTSSPVRMTTPSITPQISPEKTRAILLNPYVPPVTSFAPTEAGKERNPMENSSSLEAGMILLAALVGIGAVWGWLHGRKKN